MLKRRLTEERVREIAREKTSVSARIVFDLYRNAGPINADGSLAEGLDLACDPQDGSLVLHDQGNKKVDRDLNVVAPAGSAERDHLLKDRGVSRDGLPKPRLKLFLERHARSR